MHNFLNKMNCKNTQFVSLKKFSNKITLQIDYALIILFVLRASTAFKRMQNIKRLRKNREQYDKTYTPILNGTNDILFSELPSSILFDVAAFLTEKDIFEVSSTCKQLYNKMTDDMFWQTIFEKQDKVEKFIVDNSDSYFVRTQKLKNFVNYMKGGNNLTDDDKDKFLGEEFMIREEFCRSIIKLTNTVFVLLKLAGLIFYFYNKFARKDFQYLNSKCLFSTTIAPPHDFTYKLNKIKKKNSQSFTNNWESFYMACDVLYLLTKCIGAIVFVPWMMISIILKTMKLTLRFIQLLYLVYESTIIFVPIAYVLIFSMEEFTIAELFHHIFSLRGISCFAYIIYYTGYLHDVVKKYTKKIVKVEVVEPSQIVKQFNINNKNAFQAYGKIFFKTLDSLIKIKKDNIGFGITIMLNWMALWTLGPLILYFYITNFYFKVFYMCMLGSKWLADMFVFVLGPQGFGVSFAMQEDLLFQQSNQLNLKSFVFKKYWHSTELFFER